MLLGVTIAEKLVLDNDQTSNLLLVSHSIFYATGLPAEASSLTISDQVQCILLNTMVPSCSHQKLTSKSTCTSSPTIRTAKYGLV